MTQIGLRDFFSDESVLLDPYAWFEEARERGPVWREDERGLVYVTGHQEAIEILRNGEDFSSVINVGGPLVPLPFVPEGNDISAKVTEHWAAIAGPDLVVSYDGLRHSQSRALLNRLFVPSRLKANEEFMEGMAAQMAADAVAAGKCEVVQGLGVPYVTMVVADLLGVPAEDRKTFMEVIEQGPTAGDTRASEAGQDISTLIFLGQYFMRYLAERRAEPLPDIMSELANATFPDGTTPDLLEVVKLAVFLFAAGQDTSAKLIANSLRMLSEEPEVQAALRADPQGIPAFIEERLRLEGSTKSTFRLAKRTVEVGGVVIPAGHKVVVLVGAANRDPRRWDNPAEHDSARPRIQEHLGFGRGPHVCIGAPLARVEVRIMLEQLLARTKRIAIDEAVHGLAGARQFKYEPSYIIRGLTRLHLTLEAA